MEHYSEKIAYNILMLDVQPQKLQQSKEGMPGSAEGLHAAIEIGSTGYDSLSLKSIPGED